MAGSEAEERIRAKVEAAIRREFSDARIAHEVNISQGGCRMDLAAVRSTSLALVEIKSERDVLKRLPEQVRQALTITGDVRVYIAAKHAAAVSSMLDQWVRGPDGHNLIIWSEDRRSGRYQDNPAYCADLRRVRVLVEADEGFTDLDQHLAVHWLRQVMSHISDPRAQLEMLWADELRGLLYRHSIGTTPKASREVNKRLALELLTGRQIREGACTALRDRPFARADQALGDAA
jgi:hypothetical protein